MKTQLLLTSALCLLFAPGLRSQEAAQKPAQAVEHEVLRRLIGKWSFTFTDHLSGGEIMEGIEECKAICGGKWLLSSVHATNMPFSGVALTGWDAGKQKYVSVWVDSRSPAPLVSAGSYDAESSTMSTLGKIATLEATVRTRAVMRWADDDTRVEKIHVTVEGGEEQLGMEASCRRLADDAKVAMPAAAARGAKAAGESAPKVAAHRLFEQYAGNWTAKVSMTMPGMPAADPADMTQIDALACDGSWLHSVANGSFMGMPYEGQGLTGYDATTEEYVSFWVDNFAPHMVQLRGTCDASGKVITYAGESVGPDGQPVHTTNTATFKDADHWTMAMKSVNKDGSSAGTMTMHYTRGK